MYDFVHIIHNLRSVRSGDQSLELQDKPSERLITQTVGALEQTVRALEQTVRALEQTVRALKQTVRRSGPSVRTLVQSVRTTSKPLDIR